MWPFSLLKYDSAAQELREAIAVSVFIVRQKGGYAFIVQNYYFLFATQFFEPGDGHVACCFQCNNASQNIKKDGLELPTEGLAKRWVHWL